MSDCPPVTMILYARSYPNPTDEILLQSPSPRLTRRRQMARGQSMYLGSSSICMPKMGSSRRQSVLPNPLSYHVYIPTHQRSLPRLEPKQNLPRAARKGVQAKAFGACSNPTPHLKHYKSKRAKKRGKIFFKYFHSVVVFKNGYICNDVAFLDTASKRCRQRIIDSGAEILVICGPSEKHY